MIDVAHILGFRDPDASRSTPAQSPIRHDTTRGLTVWLGEDLWHAGPCGDPFRTEIQLGWLKGVEQKPIDLEASASRAKLF
jgi:hypothetical protein